MENDSAATMQKLLQIQETSLNLKNLSETVGTYFMIAFFIFGCIALLLNTGVVSVISIQHRKTMDRHVFYLLVLNAALVDLLRGSCLIIWSSRMLLPPDRARSHVLTKINQNSYVLLRFCGIVTILNIVLLTLNEFLFVRFPMRYTRWINRKRIIAGIVLAWALGIVFALTSVVAQKQNHRPIMIRRNHRSIFSTTARSNGSSITTLSSPLPVKYDQAETSLSFKRFLRLSITRDENDSAHDGVLNFYSLFLLIFCCVCLVVVIACYVSFYIIVRRVQKYDYSIQKARAAYINQKYITHKDATAFTPAMRLQADSTRPSVEGEAGPSLRHGDSSRLHHKMQIIRRHKYVIVIGTMIFVYMLYLVSYAAIHVLRLVQMGSDSGALGPYQSPKLILRWTLQLLTGVHAVLQPLCYFRMPDFRKLAAKTFLKCRCLKKIFSWRNRMQKRLGVTLAFTNSDSHNGGAVDISASNRCYDTFGNDTLSPEVQNKGDIDKNVIKLTDSTGWKGHISVI